MLKSEVVLKAIYAVKVSGKVVPVQIDMVCPYGGWYGTNLISRKEVRIRTAGRLRAKLSK